ncbi:MAG TPA: CRISPR-associated protein Cas4 [Smithellaceae bacterium]|jgi:CRISPR-associated exonuclease Cas4|nr:CRISPR-associated protein Cas4 [Smithellaceae bacterium]
MSYSEDDLIQLSSLQHYAFCPRQCALIHVEQVWSENLLTAEGRIMHEHVHEEGDESRGDVRIERGVSLRSLQLGLIGKVDVIEYHRQADGTWQAFPVEYKRGKPKPDDSDKVQLCAQAMCLEEMLNVHIPAGALFYGKTRRRLDVEFDEALRRETQGVAQKAHELIESGQTPKPVYAKRCESCSLIAACMPKTIQKKRSVDSYLKRMLDET